MFNQNAFKEIPQVVNGYKLGDYFSIVLPKERTNLLTNPSYEKDLATCTAQSGATLTRTTENQRHGIFSCKIKPSVASDAGMFQTTSTLVAGSTYAFSFDVFIPGGRAWLLRVSDNINTVGQKSITGKGYWQRISLVVTPVTNGAHRLFLQKDSGGLNNANTDAIFTDGWQVELCASGEEWPTTYIDGDQSGFVTNQIPPAYYWNGTPHASTSTRSGQTRAGGRIVNLSTYGFRLLSILGLGVMPLANSNTPYALIGGANYQRTLAQSRAFTLAGSMAGRTPIQLKSNRQRLERDLDAHLSGLEQPILLKYMHGDCDSPDGEVLDITCLYNAGLSGVEDNFYQERIGLQFVMFDPFVRVEGDKSALLDFQDTFIGGNNGVARRGTNGVWSILNTLNATVRALIEGPDGSIYIGGDFSSMNSVGSTSYIARWDGTNFISVGGGLGGGVTGVQALAFGSDGRLYAAGDFQNAGNGVGAVRNVAVYNPTTDLWAAMGTGLTGGTLGGTSIAIDSNNLVYVGGDFTLAGGVASTIQIAKWDGVGWSALGTGMQGASTRVAALTIGLDGFLYAGGTFTGAGGVALTSKIARWNGSVWQSISSSIVNSVFALAVAIDGTIYAGGDFTTIGGVAIVGIAKYNGNAWSALGSGITSGKLVNAIAIDKLGNILIGGNFPTAGGLTLPDFFAQWTGTSWVYIDADLPGPAAGTTLLSILVDHIGNVYYGYRGNNGSTLRSGGQVVVNNRGNIRAEPVFVIDGPTQLFQVANFTTGKYVFFNLTLKSGERVTLTLKQGNLSFVSNFRGNILSTVLPGSALANFELAPGNNAIGVFMLNSSGNAGAYLTYRETYSSISGSVRQN